MNTKVKRMLSAIALVCKDEDPDLIEAIHNVIVDKRDGYSFDFKQSIESWKCFVDGKAY